MLVRGLTRLVRGVPTVANWGWGLELLLGMTVLKLLLYFLCRSSKLIALQEHAVVSQGAPPMCGTPSADHRKDVCHPSGTLQSGNPIPPHTVHYCTVLAILFVLYCPQDHLLDVATNSVALASALLTAQMGWWVDPLGAIVLVLYTLVIWARTLHENFASMAGLSARPELLGRVLRAALGGHGLVLGVPWMRSWLVGELYIFEVRAQGFGV